MTAACITATAARDPDGRYRVGQTQRLFAYTAAPPESATTVDVDLGVLGVLGVAKDVPVTG